MQPVFITNRQSGFFSELHSVLNGIQCARRENLMPVPFWRGGFQYWDKHTPNGWEQFFKPIYTGIDFEHVNPGRPRFYGWDGMQEVNRKVMRTLYKENVTLQPKVNDYIQTCLRQLNLNNTLGVHIRFTDKIAFNPHMKRYIAEIDKVIDNYDNIFVASDSLEALSQLQQIYGSKVQALNVQRNNEGLSSPIGLHYDDRLDKHRHGVECLADAYALSKCRMIIRAASNLSVFSLWMNPEADGIDIGDWPGERWVNAKC